MTPDSESRGRQDRRSAFGIVIEVNRIIAFQMRAEKTTWLIRFTEMFRRL